MTEDYDPEVVAGYELETWSRCSESYVDTFAGITGETIPLLIRSGRIGEGSDVLEIGCGPGHVAARIAGLGAKVTGVDFSERMVEIATASHPGISFRVADAEQLPFAEESFDAVVANFVVHHLARPDRVFQEIRRVLRPGGRFAFVVWGAPEDQTSIGAFFAAVSAHHDLEALPHGPLFGVIDREVYEPMLVAADLPLTELSLHDVTWTAGSLDPVVHGFWEWGHLAALPEQTQDRIRGTMRENSRPYAESGGYRFPHSVLLGTATRP